jgi:Phage tail tube protein
MGFVAQAGHFGVKTQAVKGTYMSPGAVAPNQGVFLFFRSGALGGNRELLVPDPEIGGSRDIPDAQLGPISYSGEIDMYARMESLATLIRGALGALATTGTAITGYTHTITPADTIPWMSVEEKIANGYESFKYTDAKINTFHMEADANGYLMATAGMIALKQELVTPTAIGVQRRDSSPLLVGSNICVRWGGVDLPAKSFSLDINNNLEDDDYRLCSMNLGDAVEKRREVTMGVTIRPNDALLWRTAMWGAPAATAPLGQSYKDDVEIEINSYEDIPGATAGVKYNTTITVPQAIIAPFSLDPSGDDVLEHDIEIRAVRPDLGVPILTAEVRNSFATVA